MTQFFCSIDITGKKLNQHQYRVLATFELNSIIFGE